MALLRVDMAMLPEKGRTKMKKLILVAAIIGIWAMTSTPIEARCRGICLRQAPVKAILAGRLIVRGAVQRIVPVTQRIVQRAMVVADETRDTICNVNVVVQDRLRRTVIVGRQIIYRAGQRAVCRPLLRSIFSCQ